MAYDPLMDAAGRNPAALGQLDPQAFMRLLQALPPEQQFLLYRNAPPQQRAIFEQSLGGDQQRSDWINRLEGSVRGNGFNPATGQFNYYANGSASPITGALPDLTPYMAQQPGMAPPPQAAALPPPGMGVPPQEVMPGGMMAQPAAPTQSTDPANQTGITNQPDGPPVGMAGGAPPPAPVGDPPQAAGLPIAPAPAAPAPASPPVGDPLQRSQRVVSPGGPGNMRQQNVAGITQSLLSRRPQQIR